jgi:hypothetical protein
MKSTAIPNNVRFLSVFTLFSALILLENFQVGQDSA